MNHIVLNRSITAPFPENTQQIYLGMGCFWGSERLFWQIDGIWTTAVGYAGGTVENPSYEQVCQGNTGHAEVVMVCFDPNNISLKKIVSLFFEHHDPTQGLRQGADKGSQYRSVIYCTSESQCSDVMQYMQSLQSNIEALYNGNITTEVKKNIHFYLAEGYHQQYLAKNPQGYCGLKKYCSL